MSATATPATSVTVPTDQLVDRLTAVARVAQGGGSFSQLAGIRWIIGGGQLVLEAVGRDLAIRSMIQIMDDAEATFVLPAKVALSVAKSFASTSATFTVGDGTVQVTSGAASYDLLTLREDDVAPFPPMPEAEPVSIAIEALAETYAKVEKSAGRDDVRLILTGALVVIDGDEISMCATDAHRLALKHHRLAESTGAGFRGVVPRLTLAEFAGMGSGPADLFVTDDRIALADEHSTIVSRMVDGTFPNYGVLLNEPLPLQTTVATAELKATLRRMEVVGADAVVVLTFADGALTVSANSAKIGGLKESIPLPWDGDELRIGFELALLRDGVGLIDAETAVLRLKEPRRPLLLTGEGDDSFTYLCMPRALAD